jgi:RNA polymerase sigma-70 factor (ECF subfamily)
MKMRVIGIILEPESISGVILNRKGLLLAKAQERGVGNEDSASIERFLAGDEGGFNKLVLTYKNRVFNLCYRFMGNHSEAEDVAQEVFVTIYRSLKNFRGDALFSTWLYRITVNHCKNRLKYLGRRQYFQTRSLDQPLQTEEGEVYPMIEDTGPGPEEKMSRREVKDFVQEKINGLDAEHREVILLRDIEGLSYQEIAEVLDLREGTVKSRIHRARLELKDKLGKEFDH